MNTQLLEDAAFGRARVVPLTVDQYHEMAAAGILDADIAIELLDGMLVAKERGGSTEGGTATVSPRHALCVALLARLAQRLARPAGHLRTQQPITIPPTQEPEPDVAFVRGAAEDYAVHHPGPADVSCVVEVADSSLHRDRTLKLRIYANAEIPQYVIVNLVDGCLEVHDQPDAAAGRYRRTTTLHPGAMLEVRLPGGEALDVAVASLLP